LLIINRNFDKIINKLDKKPSGIKKPKHFLYSAWNSGMNFANNSFNGYFGGGMNAEEKDELSDDDYYHDPSKDRKKKNKKGHKDTVGTWFPQPGKNNLLHTITLFAVFIHRCCNDKLAGIGLKDQGCTLLQPILR